MSSISEVAKVISAINDGFSKSVLSCMEDNTSIVEELVREQLMCGVDGKGEYLSPTYDTDPYFDEDGPWKGRAKAYKKWKMDITPPSFGPLTRIHSRPSDVPNLFIDGTFHDSIKAAKDKVGLVMYTSGFRDGPTIERKYGANIFNLTGDSRKYFIDIKLLPHLLSYFKKCGYVV